MMIKGCILEDCYEISENKQLDVIIRESNTSGMQGCHMHSHYEICYISHGNVSVILPGQIHSGGMARIVAIPPYTPHHVILEPGTQLYRHSNISFTEGYISRFIDESNLFTVLESTSPF